MYSKMSKTVPQTYCCYGRKVMLFLCLIKHQAMKVYGRVEIHLHVFLTSAFWGHQWSVLCPGYFIPRIGVPQLVQMLYKREKNSKPLLGIKPQILSHPIHSLVTILTGASQLYPYGHLIKLVKLVSTEQTVIKQKKEENSDF